MNTEKEKINDEALQDNQLWEFLAMPETPTGKEFMSVDEAAWSYTKVFYEKGFSPDIPNRADMGGRVRSITTWARRDFLVPLEPVILSSYSEIKKGVSGKNIAALGALVFESLTALDLEILRDEKPKNKLDIMKRREILQSLQQKLSGTELEGLVFDEREKGIRQQDYFQKVKNKEIKRRLYTDESSSTREEGRKTEYERAYSENGEMMLDEQYWWNFRNGWNTEEMENRIKDQDLSDWDSRRLANLKDHVLDGDKTAVMGCASGEVAFMLKEILVMTGEISLEESQEYNSMNYVKYCELIAHGEEVIHGLEARLREIGKISENDPKGLRVKEAYSFLKGS